NYVCRHNGAVAGAGFRDEMAAIGCTDDSAPQRHDSVNAFAIENHVIAGRKKPFESVPETNHFPAKFFRGEHDSSQDRVESRTIATASQNTNPRLHFRNSWIKAIFWGRPDDRQRPIGRIAASRAAKAQSLH